MSTKSFAVWVGSLSPTTKEDSLHKAFKQFGPVKNVALQRDRATGSSRQFAFVNFLNKEVGDIAAREMHGKFLEGSTIKAKGPTQLEAESRKQKKDFRPLTDCSFFLTGQECKPKDGEQCPYRHIEAAKATKETCTKWKKRQCKNQACPYRHPGGKGLQVYRCPSHNMIKCRGNCGNEECDLHFNDQESFKKHALQLKEEKIEQVQLTCNQCGAVFFSPEERERHVNKSHRDGSSKVSAGASQDVNEMEPVGVFWDIENCPVPSGKSVIAIVNRIRKKFYHGRKEAEFKCVCDTTKEKKEVIDSLNKAQVDVLHVSATAKNAADDKLKQALRRFALDHQPPATVVLISGDINFSPDLSDLMHRNKFTVILVHNTQASNALKECADQVECFHDFIANLPQQEVNTFKKPKDVIVTNLPRQMDVNSIRSKLSLLSSNCGGKVIDIKLANGGQAYEAILRFADSEAAEKAGKRMDGEIVQGSKISTQICKGETKKRSKIDRQETPSSKHGAMSNRENNKWMNENQKGSKRPDNEQPSSERETKVATSEPPSYRKHNSFLSMNHPLSQPLPLAQSFYTMGLCGKSPTLSDIDVIVKNLDQQIPQKEIKKKLQFVFREHCKVNSVTIIRQGKDKVYAYVRVPKLEDAQVCVSKVNGKVLFGRKLNVELASEDALLKLRFDVSHILLSVNSGWLPLDTFVRIYEADHDCAFNLHKLDLLKDLIYIDGKPGKQFICLLYFQVGLLKVLNKNDTLVTALANTVRNHNRKTPIASLPGLYWSYTGDFLTLSEEGRPLQDIISRCREIGVIPGPIEKQAIFYKKPPVSKGGTIGKDILASEVADLLKATSGYKIPFNKFVGAYYQYFGRQCNLGDFGVKSLSELLKGITHMVEIVGQDEARMISFTNKYRAYLLHSELELLLSRRKRVPLLKLLPYFYQFYGRRLLPKNYGFSSIFALVKGIQGSLKVKENQGKHVLILDKGTRKKSNATGKLKSQVMDLLSSTETGTIPLMSFGGEFQKKYGKPIVLSGFKSKNMNDLLRHLSDTIEIVGSGAEKLVTLKNNLIARSPLQNSVVTVFNAVQDSYIMESDFMDLLKEKIPNAVGINVEHMLQSVAVVLGKDGSRVLLKKRDIDEEKAMYHLLSLATAFLAKSKGLKASHDAVFQHVRAKARDFGIDMKGHDFEKTLSQNPQAFKKLPNKSLQLTQEAALAWLSWRICDLIDSGSVVSSVNVMEMIFQSAKVDHSFFDFPDMDSLVASLPRHLVKVSSVDKCKLIYQGPVKSFEKKAITLLSELAGVCLLSSFAPQYQKKYGEACEPSKYGCKKMLALIQQLRHSMILIGSGPKRVIMQRKDARRDPKSEAPRTSSVSSEEQDYYVVGVSAPYGSSDDDAVVVEEETEWLSDGESVTESTVGDLLNFSDSEESIEEWWMSPVPTSLPEPVLSAEVELMSFSGFNGQDIEGGGLPVSSFDLITGSPEIATGSPELHNFDPVRDDTRVGTGSDDAESQNDLKMIEDLIPLMHHDVSKLPLPDDDFDLEDIESLSDKEEDQQQCSVVADAAPVDLPKKDVLLDGDLSGLVSMLNLNVKKPRIAARFPTQVAGINPDDSVSK